MKSKTTSVMIVLILVVAGFFGFITLDPEVVNAQTTWYVGSGPGNDSATINAAINLAGDGDTIFVHSGVYIENVVINHSINLIGENKQNTIITGGDSKAVLIDSDWVNLTGFTITNSETGIRINSSSYINILGNEVHNNMDGIITTYSSSNTYVNNTVYDNIGDSNHNGDGFFFSGAPYSHNNIIGNVVYNNSGNGIHLEDRTVTDYEYFSNNSIIDNIVYGNTGDGIFIGQGSINYKDQGGQNSIIGNVVHHNGNVSIIPRAGIRIFRSNDNLITQNVVYDNDNGIYLENAWFGYYNTSNNILSDNIVYNNDEGGIVLIAAANNTLINNSIFGNFYNVFMADKSHGNRFINCTLSAAKKDEFNLNEDSYAFLLNTTFNKAWVYYGDPFSTLNVNWFMHVNVVYNNGDPAGGARIWINDSYGSNILNSTVDSQGWYRWIVGAEYIERDLNGDHFGDRIFSYTPHDVVATDGNHWGTANPTMDISKIVYIDLGVPPPLLPPKNLTTKVVDGGNNVELEWDPPPSPTLDHYLIYRADSATDFDFSIPYNNSITWSNPLNSTWIDPDPGITTVDDDFYYIVRAANANESDVSSTSNTAGIWTKTFPSGISTFSLPLEPFVKKDVEFYCQDMNATYIKWMNLTSRIWMQHDKGISGNNSMIEVGEGYEIGFLGKSIQTRYTFTGFPGAMIIYDDDTGFLGFDPSSNAKNLSASVDPNGNVTLNWKEPSSMNSGDWYEVYYSHTRDGFLKTLGSDYDLACPPLGFGNDTTTILNLGVNIPGTRLYFMVVPFNSLGVRGASTYSIGIWTEEYLAQYDTYGIPLKLENYQTADWFCDNIPDTVGINYFINNQQRWGWHSTLMPQGAFDPNLVMGEGYQISTSSATKFVFIGR